MSLPDLRTLAHSPVLSPSPLWRYYETPARHAVDGDVILISLGGPGPDYNAVVVIGPEDPRRVTALAGDFFGDWDYCVTLEAERAGPMEEWLLAGGWELDEEEPALVLSPIPASPPPPDLDIRPVSDEPGYEVFLAISETARRWVPSLAAALDPAVALFVGYAEGVPVATSRVACAGGVGDITGVVTLDAFRRRGFGSAMTWAAIAEAAKRGCTAATLTATEMGYPLYRRMGFVPVCSYRTYLPPTAVSEG